MTSPESVATNFPVQILSLVASGTDQTTYNSILEVRTAMHSNTTTIPSAEDGGIHSHLALVLTAPEYLAVAGVAFLPPVHPGPVAHHSPQPHKSSRPTVSTRVP
eukprot:scaffold74965_cov30-Attheya_sp.AAC.2